METVRKTISVVEPVNEAIQKTSLLLFEPFNLEKWFIIGFCAWLASLLQEGIRGATNFNFKNHPATPEQTQITEFIRTHIVAVVTFAAVAIIVFFAIFLVLLWLNSRGRFMFIDCLAKNKAHVIEPWKTFKKQANSLFGFRLLLMLLGWVIIAAFFVSIIFLTIILDTIKENFIASIAILCTTIFFLIMAVLFFGCVQTLTLDFAIPIMYIHKIKTFAAWGKFMPMLKAHFWKITLYLLFKAFIGISIGIITLLITFFGCCCMCGTGIILFIPYIGTVILLPFAAFLRFYTLCFMRQFGTEYDAFTANA